jgi:hypothetical protein
MESVAVLMEFFLQTVANCASLVCVYENTAFRALAEKRLPFPVRQNSFKCGAQKLKETTAVYVIKTGFLKKSGIISI